MSLALKAGDWPPFLAAAQQRALIETLLVRLDTLPIDRPILVRLLKAELVYVGHVVTLTSEKLLTLWREPAQSKTVAVRQRQVAKLEMVLENTLNVRLGMRLPRPLRERFTATVERYPVLSTRLGKRRIRVSCALCGGPRWQDLAEYIDVVGKPLALPTRCDCNDQLPATPRVGSSRSSIRTSEGQYNGC